MIKILIATAAIAIALAWGYRTGREAAYQEIYNKQQNNQNVHH